MAAHDLGVNNGGERVEEVDGAVGSRRGQQRPGVVAAQHGDAVQVLAGQDVEFHGFGDEPRHGHLPRAAEGLGGERAGGVVPGHGHTARHLAVCRRAVGVTGSEQAEDLSGQSLAREAEGPPGVLAGGDRFEAVEQILVVGQALPGPLSGEQAVVAQLAFHVRVECHSGRCLREVDEGLDDAQVQACGGGWVDAGEPPCLGVAQAQMRLSESVGLLQQRPGTREEVRDGTLVDGGGARDRPAHDREHPVGHRDTCLGCEGEGLEERFERRCRARQMAHRVRQRPQALTRRQAVQVKERIGRCRGGVCGSPGAVAHEGELIPAVDLSCGRLGHPAGPKPFADGLGDLPHRQELRGRGHAQSDRSQQFLGEGGVAAVGRRQRDGVAVGGSEGEALRLVQHRGQRGRHIALCVGQSAVAGVQDGDGMQGLALVDGSADGLVLQGGEVRVVPRGRGQAQGQLAVVEEAVARVVEQQQVLSLLGRTVQCPVDTAGVVRVLEDRAVRLRQAPKIGCGERVLEIGEIVLDRGQVGECSVGRRPDEHGPRERGVRKPRHPRSPPERCVTW